MMGTPSLCYIKPFQMQEIETILNCLKDCFNHEKTPDNSVNDHTKPLLLLGLLQPGIIIEFDRDSCEEKQYSTYHIFKTFFG